MHPKEITLQAILLIFLSCLASIIELHIIEEPPDIVFLRENDYIARRNSIHPSDSESTTTVDLHSGQTSQSFGDSFDGNNKINIFELPTVSEYCVDGKCDVSDLSIVIYISIETAKKLFDDGEAQFVDARSESAYLEGHIPYAQHMPVKAFSAGWPDNIDMLMKELVTVVYCEDLTCDASQIVAQHLARYGLKELRIIDSGFPGWKKAGLPVSKGREDEW